MTRKKYVKAMMKAIRKAQQDYFMTGRAVSKTDGLRVIKRFEKVNGVEFDPFDKFHVEQVDGWGWMEGDLRDLNNAFKCNALNRPNNDE